MGDNQLCLEHIIRPLFSDRTFIYSWPFLWNKLPLVIWDSPNVTVFQSKFKTYSSKQALSLSPHLKFCYILTFEHFIEGISCFEISFCEALWNIFKI